MLDEAAQITEELKSEGRQEGRTALLHLELFRKSVADELEALSLKCHLYPVNSIGAPPPLSLAPSLSPSLPPSFGVLLTASRRKDSFLRAGTHACMKCVRIHLCEGYGGVHNNFIEALDWLGQTARDSNLISRVEAFAAQAESYKTLLRQEWPSIEWPQKPCCGRSATSSAS